MASAEFLKTMISHNQKELYLKLELLEYDKKAKDFVIVDTLEIQEHYLPELISNVNGNLSINTEQDVRYLVDLELVNDTGFNNWGADFNADEGEFKWWLDKRLILHVGLRLDDSDEIEYEQLAYLIVTQFETNHDLTAYPVIKIQASSKECLYATRRGKFLWATTIKRGAVMTDTIVTLLKAAGEKDERIRIDPQINKTSIKLEDADGDDFGLWTTRADTKMEIDTTDYVHGKSSFRFDIGTNQVGVVATKTFKYVVDMSLGNAIGIWGRCSVDFFESTMSLCIYDRKHGMVDLPIKALVGHVIDGEDLDYIDNWRNMILTCPEIIKEFTQVYKIELVLNNMRIEHPFSLWIDQVYFAEIKNMLPYDLTYGAGTTQWSAIKEIADLLDANAYFDQYGDFILEKKKYPMEMNTNEKFEYDAYNVLQPVVTYKDTQKNHNIYGGSSNTFDEYELANHINVVGGNTSSTVISMADIVLTEEGLVIREKGKTLNSRGKVRAIDQFSQTGTPPTILNENTNVEQVWWGHQNQQAVINKYPNGFPHLTKPPIRNFTVERIGDFIYHHNNANPDPVIVYTYEAKNRALYELRKRLSFSERLSIISAPYYTLKGNDIIKVTDSLYKIDENYEVISIGMPLNGSAMSITVSKLKNLILDVPYFDISGLACNACWYGYDAYALAFPYAWQDWVYNVHM